MTRLAIVIGAIFVPGVAAAHAGHGSGGDSGVIHFLTEPSHVGLIVVAALLSFALRKAVLRRGALGRVD